MTFMQGRRWAGVQGFGPPQPRPRPLVGSAEIRWGFFLGGGGGGGGGGQLKLTHPAARSL